MKKTQIALIGFLAILIVGCWAILAFFIREDLVSRFSLWSSMVIGTAAIIIAFIALYISYLAYKKDVNSDKKDASIENRNKK